MPTIYWFRVTLFTISKSISLELLISGLTDLSEKQQLHPSRSIVH